MNETWKLPLLKSKDDRPMNDIHRSIVIDVDDTVLNLGDRRIELFRRHFPRVDINEDDIRRDVGLSFLGDRNSPPSQKFLCDLFD